MVEVLSSKKPRTKPDLTIAPHGVGHNSDLPDFDRTLVFIGRKMELAAEKRVLVKKQKELVNQITNAGLTDKAVKQGMDDFEGDADAVLKHYRMVFHVSKAMGSPLSRQLTLFAEPGAGASRQTELEIAYDKGKILALLGKDADEQAFASGDLKQEHLRGWNDGQAFRRNEFLRNAEAVNAAEQKKKDEAAEKAKKLVREAVEDLDTETAVH